jgi:hypothetical protein
MRSRLLLLSILVSSAIACNPAPDTVEFHPHINNQLRPGETGTLLELNDDRHWIEAIALSDNNLFIAVEWAGVYRMPKYGGDVVPLDEDANGAFYQLATDGDRVYWIHVTFDDSDYPFTEIKSQPVEGGPTTIIARGEFGIFNGGPSNRFQIAGGFAYFSDDLGNHPALTERVPLEGGQRQTLLSFAEAIDTPPWVADDTGLYLTDTTIQRLTAPGQTPEVLATSPGPMTAPFGSDANAIYLQTSNGLWSMSKADRSFSPIVAVSDDGYTGTGVMIDDSNIYGVDPTNAPAQLVRFPKNGGPVAPLAEVQDCLVYGGGAPFMAVDSQYVFLVCGPQNRIMVAPNPAAP